MKKRLIVALAVFVIVTLLILKPLIFPSPEKEQDKQEIIEGIQQEFEVTRRGAENESNQEIIEEEQGKQEIDNQGMTEESNVTKIIKPPDVNITKYKGLWMPFLRETKIALNDISNLKTDGINIVAIGIRVCRDEEFYVCEDENEIKNSINEFHKNGIKTFLILNPAHPGSRITPHSPEASGRHLLDELTPLVLKWSIIAEKYGVEMFSPVNEPQLLSHENEHVSSWAQEILPLIRERYNGNIIFEVQCAKENVYNLSGYDYVADGGLTCNKDIKDHPEWIEHMVDERLATLKSIYPVSKYLFFGAGAFTGPDYYWWEPIAPENMRDTHKEFPEDFFNVSFESQADFYDIFFNRTWNEVDGYFLPVYKGWEYRNKPAEEVVRKWFNEM